MAIADETTLRIVLYEGAGAATLNATERGSTLPALMGQGYAVTCPAKGAVAPAAAVHGEVYSVAEFVPKPPTVQLDPVMSAMAKSVVASLLV